MIGHVQLVTVVGMTLGALCLQYISGSYFDCDSGSCSDENFICAQNDPCTLHCTTGDDCSNSNLTCAANEQCTVNCLGDENCCSHIKIDGTQASSLNITSSYRAMRWGVFLCPNGGNCDILCDEWDACKFINVTAFNSKNVTL